MHFKYLISSECVSGVLAVLAAHHGEIAPGETEDVHKGSGSYHIWYTIVLPEEFARSFGCSMDVLNAGGRGVQKF